MEYGLVECMPIYSGGLGVLSGDHLKACQRCGDPAGRRLACFIRKVICSRLLNPGWLATGAQSRSTISIRLPVRPVQNEQGQDLMVHIKLPTGKVLIKVWCMDVGRVKLYLLDTNIPENEQQEHREITDQLYGGDILTRIRQEIVLGIGGLRALHALEPEAHGMAHERRPLRVPCHGADAPADRATEPFLR